jgi:hypothetical protein
LKKERKGCQPCAGICRGRREAVRIAGLTLAVVREAGRVAGLTLAVVGEGEKEEGLPALR